MNAMTIVTTSETDDDLLRAAEAEIRARRSAEDSVWGIRTVLAESDPGNPYLGPEATLAFLNRQIARADCGDTGAQDAQS